MRPDEEHARVRELERGTQAKAILDSPLWDEAYERLVNTHLTRMLSRDVSDDETLEAKRCILALYDVKRRMVEIMQTGKLAEMQIEERNERAKRAG